MRGFDEKVLQKTGELVETYFKLLCYQNHVLTYLAFVTFLPFAIFLHNVISMTV